MFLGLFQLSQIFVAREVLHHSAARAARAKTVGFNRFMVYKCMRVAAIPNAGKMIVPTFANQNEKLRAAIATSSPGQLWSDVLTRANDLDYSTEQTELELALMPDFLASDNIARARFIMDYEDWDSVGYHDATPVLEDLSVGSVLHSETSQTYPLKIPLHRAFYLSDSVNLSGDSYLENHYSSYIDDMFW